MAFAVFTTNVYLLPGMSIKVEADFDPDRGIGEFAYMGTLEVSSGRNEDLAANHGFYVEDTEVGTITPVDGEAAVIYTHKKPAKNSIWFVAREGAGARRGVCNVMSVPIHDHSSIVQGGPAYGTYFSDDEADAE
jgi:hypothetical protein